MNFHVCGSFWHDLFHNSLVIIITLANGDTTPLVATLEHLHRAAAGYLRLRLAR